MYEEIDEDEPNWWSDPDETEEERLQREQEEEDYWQIGRLINSTSGY